MKKVLFLSMMLIGISMSSIAQWETETSGNISYSKGQVSVNVAKIDTPIEFTVKGDQIIYGHNASLFFGGIDNTTAGWGQYGIEYHENEGGLNFWKPSGSNGFKNWVLFLQDDGRVGIGTNTLPQGFKLTVDGSIAARKICIGTIKHEEKYLVTVAGGIHAREVLVTETAGGADFVFEEDFELRSIVELEEFVKQNKHLPDVPSAKQMEKDGLNIAEFQIKLLQKIEELTLYIIKQQKEIDELKNNR